MSRGLSHLASIAPEKIVEIGCGGGKNAGELLKKYPSSHVPALTLPEGEYDLATAFETIYFWPGLKECLIHLVL